MHFLKAIKVKDRLTVLMIILYFGIGAVRAINKPTRELKRLFKLAQQGDLTNYATHSATDELGETTKYYNLMMATEQSASQFREITKEVHQIGPQMEHMAQVMVQISSHSNEVTESAIELSNRSEENLASMQKIQQQVVLQKQATADISDEIRSIAKNMRALTQAVDRFKV